MAHKLENFFVNWETLNLMTMKNHLDALKVETD